MAPPLARPWNLNLMRPMENSSRNHFKAEFAILDRTAHVYMPKSIQHSNSAHSYKIKRCRVPFRIYSSSRIS